MGSHSSIEDKKSDNLKVILSEHQFSKSEGTEREFSVKKVFHFFNYIFELLNLLGILILLTII
jgi:hypothetical protein